MYSAKRVTMDAMLNLSNLDYRLNSTIVRPEIQVNNIFGFLGD